MKVVNFWQTTIFSLLGGEQAWTPNFYLKSFDMDSVQVGKAVFLGTRLFSSLVHVGLECMWGPNIGFNAKKVTNLQTESRPSLTDV